MTIQPSAASNLMSYSPIKLGVLRFKHWRTPQFPLPNCVGFVCKRDLFAGIIDGKIDFAQSADTHSAFDGKTAQRLIAISKFKFHGLSLDWAETCAGSVSRRAAGAGISTPCITGCRWRRWLVGHFFSGQQGSVGYSIVIVVYL